jgi:two-component system phosphate regulon response regulator OmpR
LAAADDKDVWLGFMAERLLIIDDDARLAAMVSDYLTAAGFVVDRRFTGGEGLAAIERETFDAIILDVMLPDSDGFEICRKIRARAQIPILMLTARGEETDRIVGLEIGADDYLPKPFNPRELQARLRAILRRGRALGPGDDAELRFGRLRIDRASRMVRVDGKEKTLTSFQFDLLVALADNAGRVLNRDRLMDLVKGEEFDAFDRSIDVHISRIRSAIEDDPKHPRRIITVRGAGYVFARRQDEEK